MIHQGTVQIETTRLILRRFTMDDAQPMYQNWASDPKVTPFLRWPTHKDIGTTQKVLADWIKQYEKNDFYQWAIVLKPDGNRLVGGISVVWANDDLDILHIGYCIGSRWWRQGITSEALSGILPFLFEQVQANRIESQHDPRNPNSGKVMEKCGLQFEGILRQADFNNQGICDACMHAILAEEYLKRK